MANQRLRNPLAPQILVRHGQAECAAGGAHPFGFSGLRLFVPGVVVALGRRSALALPAPAPGLAFLWGIGFAHAARAAALLNSAFVQFALLRASKSIEATANGGQSFGFLPRFVPPLSAPHVQR